MKQVQLPKFARRDRILEHLRSKGRASAQELVPVAETTLGSVRDCLKELCRTGIVKKSPVSFELAAAKKGRQRKSVGE